jgi:hypothetical protein
MSFSQQNINFLNSQFDRMGIPEEQREDYMNNMYDFSQQVRHIESDNNPLAAAGTTSAKGVYQFTDDSVNTGLNRMGNLGYNQDFIGGISQNPSEWDDEQADSMFLSNMFAQSGSDAYLNRIGGGDAEARQEAYYKFHHTAPDEATINRVNKMMPTIQDQVVAEQGADAFTQPAEDTSQNFGSNFGTGKGKIANFFKGFL